MSGASSNRVRAGIGIALMLLTLLFPSMVAAADGSGPR